MARQQEGSEHTRKIQQSNGVYYVTLPIQMVKKLRWRERQKVIVKKFGKGIRIKDWVKRGS